MPTKDEEIKERLQRMQNHAAKGKTFKRNYRMIRSCHTCDFSVMTDFGEFFCNSDKHPMFDEFTTDDEELLDWARENGREVDLWGICDDFQ